MNPKQQSFLSILLLISAFTLSRAEVTSNVGSLEFIDVPVGKTFKQHAILGNAGNERIDIQAVEIIGDDAEFFSTSYTEKLPRFIYPGNTPWMKVYFSPTEPGLFSAQLILNLSDGSQLIYPLEGSTTDNNLGVVLNVEEFDFGVVPVGEREKLYGIFENLGTLRTDIVDSSISGPDADLFSSTYVDKLPRFIYPGSTPWMPVYYEPTRGGQHRATLTLNLSDGSEVVLPLSGGEATQSGGELILLTGNINFDDTFITQSQSGIITVLNNEASGGPAATISNTQIQNNVFSISNPLPITLAPGESVDLEVVFAPEAIGFEEDTIVLVSENTQLSIQVSGQAIELPAGTLEISPEQIDFGEATIGESINRMVTITNTQTNPPAAATINTLAFGENVYSVLDAPELPLVLASGESLSLTIQFQPPGDLIYLDALVINGDFSTSTDVFGVGTSGGSELTAALEFTIDGTSYSNADRPAIDLGNINIGQSQNVTIEVANPSGTESGAITAINLDGTNTSDVVIVNQPQLPLQLSAGESIELQLQITGANVGAIEQTVSITTDPLTDGVGFELNISGEIVLEASIGTELIGAAQGPVRLDLGGISTLNEGEIAAIDPLALGVPRGLFSPGPSSAPRWRTDASENPAGATLLFDLFDGPAPCNPENGLVDGLAHDPSGLLYATLSLDSGVFQQDADCLAVGVSKLAIVDTENGIPNVIGEIVDQNQNPILHIGGLAINPLSGEMYLGTSVEDPCGRCLYQVDKNTAIATLITEFDLADVPWIGGLAFTRDGDLKIINVAGPGFTNGVRELVTVNPVDGSLIDRESVLLEQQFEVSGGSGIFTIRTAGFQGLTIDPDGALIASWANGGTSLYKRVRGTIDDKFGNPVDSDEQWVWRLIGDAGAWFGEIEYTQVTNTQQQQQ